MRIFMRAYCKIYLITRKRHAFRIDFFVIRATRARQCLAIHFTLSSEWERPTRMSHYKGRDISASVRRLLRAEETKYIYSTDYYLTDLCAVDIRNMSMSTPTRRPPIKAFLNECVHAENIAAPDDD